MKAMIFAAGLGTRLRPLTDNRPKALVEVGGVPMLERIILNLRAAGFDRIVVNVHHFASMIEVFLEEHDNFGVDIAVSDERSELLDTGGALVKARGMLGGDGPVLVHNADILTDLDYRGMMSAHAASGADATLLVAPRVSSRYLLFDGNMRLCGWTNMNTGETLPPGLDVVELQPMAFGGIHVISPGLLDSMARYCPAGAFPIVPFYVKECQKSVIRGYRPDSRYMWFDIGKPATLSEAERCIMSRD